MPAARYTALTPEALVMMDTIARSGSFAAAARELGKVPSALTYSVRQLEDALDVLLFDRRSRQAQLTAAGAELLHEGRRLLQEAEAVANRVRRVASGWETQLAIAVDDILSQATLYDLVAEFCALCPQAGDANGGPGTRLLLSSGVLAGTWEALVSGQVDLALGIAGDFTNPGGIEVRPLGELDFVFAVAPSHPLAKAEEPITDADRLAHRAVAVADTAQRLAPVTLHLLAGQDVLTVPNMAAKLEAQLRGIACGHLPEPWARAHLAAGRLVQRRTVRGVRRGLLHYAWRAERSGPGRALAWWLERLESTATRRALIEHHPSAAPPTAAR